MAICFSQNLNRISLSILLYLQVVPDICISDQILSEDSAIVPWTIPQVAKPNFPSLIPEQLSVESSQVDISRSP